ncbi:MAG: carbamoyltransferase HypF [Candidatus Bathyarchaeota archaeon]|nr:MAG: carbamoyltransferase HypF [Candidatus Bathyarchaeota archaeon]
MRVEARVRGIVQGVGFRPFIYRIALENRLVGYVRNRGDAYVEIVVDGKERDVRSFLQDLVEKKPPLARIHNVTTKHLKEEKKFRSFTIMKSSEEVELSGSVIPPDIAICNECLDEMGNPKDHRYNYFFITCTNCGPRYTVIKRLPYDRPNTTMHEFAMCDFCQNEYAAPINRRFHAQTVACQRCGPQVYLTSNDGQQINVEDPIREASRLLEDGHIVAVKGYGGFHVATSTTKSEPIAKLRTVKHRAGKPFAIMARNLETVRSFAEINTKEAELLTCHVRPIVLLKKSTDYYLSDLIAPSLHNIGVMLPYTGLHYLLFDETEEPAFVMTSANPPNEPIVTNDSRALSQLGNLVDYFLFHNRRIAQRCDDSVIRVHGENISLIRRSRGYAPAPICLRQPEDTPVLGLGAELNTTSCILFKDRAFLSQHLGDVENLETLQFQRDATDHLMRLTNCKIEAIACDLHPKFTTTILAQELGEELDLPVFQIQHHWAHAAALMAEHSLDEMISIVCDGYGYGLDGSAWGGEILDCTRKSGFQRLGHLEEQPMVGGDLATRYPLRMMAGILHGTADIEGWLLANCGCFPHGQKEVEIMFQQLGKSLVPKTTSCGRVLDAVSAVLGICYERTYEGEPAMKLESVALAGRNVVELKSITRENVIDTTSLVNEIFNQRNTFSTADLAFSTQSYIARSLALLACEKAKQLGVDVVGFSGGVAYNEHITSIIRRAVKEHGLRFVAHELVPPGDGGLSFGQALAAAWQMKA